MAGRTLILYRSKTGFTKKYAQIIAERVNGTLMNFEMATPKLLSSFETIAFGSRMHAGHIDSLENFRKMFQESGASRLILFVTGAMPDTDRQALDEMWRQNLTQEEYNSVPHFYLPGGLCYEKMNFADRLMMRMFVFMLKWKKGKTSEEIRMAEMIGKSYDISSEEYADEIAACLKSY